MRCVGGSSDGTKLFVWLTTLIQKEVSGAKESFTCRQNSLPNIEKMD